LAYGEEKCRETHGEETIVTDTPNRNQKGEWTPDKYFQILGEALDDYEREHPHWRIEVLVSLISWGLKNLKYDIEEKHAVTWNNPFLELHYNVDWNWDSPRVCEGLDHVYSGMTLGNFTKQNTIDQDTTKKTISEIMVRRLNTLALEDVTNGIWFEVKDNHYDPILPLELSQELNAIKGKAKRRDAYEQLVRPFSIGAAAINYFGMDMPDETKLSKQKAKQPGKALDIGQISFNGEVNGHKIELSLVFQIHPLIANYDEKKAYHPIFVGLLIQPKDINNNLATINPATWSKGDRDILWKELLTEIEKLTERFIPRAETQTSEIITINAQLEIPVPASNPEAKNRAISSILETITQAGQVREFSIKADKPARKEILADPNGKTQAPPPEKAPTSPTEGLVRLIWNSKWRIPLFLILLAGMGAIAVFAALPNESKLKILQHLGLH
jgi:hypothetical protein